MEETNLHKIQVKYIDKYDYIEIIRMLIDSNNKLIDTVCKLQEDVNKLIENQVGE